MRPDSRSLLLAALLLASGTVARADVHIVDAFGGGDFTTIHEAANAAQDGDTLVVKGGNYPFVVLPNRSLSIVAGGTVSGVST